MKLATLAAASAVCLAAFATEASAIERFESTNATGVCQGALPHFDDRLRKRPTGIVNQGAGSSFVSCSTTQDFYNPTPADQLSVLLTNSTAAELTVNCTLSVGISFLPFPSQILLPKSFVVPAGMSVEGSWFAGEYNGGMTFEPSLNVSCNLPVGAELGAVGYHIPEDGTAPAEPQAP